MKPVSTKSILTRLAFVLCCAVLLCACAEKSPEPPAATTAAAAAVQTEQTAAEAGTPVSYSPMREDDIPEVEIAAFPDEITPDFEMIPEGIDPERHMTYYSCSRFGLGVMLYKAPTIASGHALDDYIPYGAPVEVYARSSLPGGHEPSARVRVGIEYRMEYYWLWCCYDGKWGWCEDFEFLHDPPEPFYDPLFDEEVTPPEKYFDSCPPVYTGFDGMCAAEGSWHFSWDKDIPVRNRPDESAPVKRVLHGGTYVWALGTTKPESPWTFVWYEPQGGDTASYKDPDTGHYGWESVNKTYYGWIYMDDEGMLVDQAEYRESHRVGSDDPQDGGTE